MTNTADVFLTDKQLCEQLHITSRTTMRWRRDSIGPRFIRAGARHVLYARSDVETWISARKFAHRAAETMTAGTQDDLSDRGDNADGAQAVAGLAEAAPRADRRDSGVGFNRYSGRISRLNSECRVKIHSGDERE